MRTRRYPVRHPVADCPAFRDVCREWTEITLDASELMVLLGMPKGTRLVSIGLSAMTGVTITVEEPPLEV